MIVFGQVSVECIALILLVVVVVVVSLLLIWRDLKKLADCPEGSPEQSRMYEEVLFAYGAFLPAYIPPSYLHLLEEAARPLSCDEQAAVKEAEY